MRLLKRLGILFLSAMILTSLISCGKDEIVLPPHQHTYYGKHIAGNCQVKGYMEYTCACGDTYHGEEDAEYGEHTFVEDPVPVRVATQDTPGIKRRYCTVDGCSEVEYYNYEWQPNDLPDTEFD